MSCSYSYLSTAKQEPYLYKSILDVLSEQTNLHPDLELFICRRTDGTRESLTNKELNQKSKQLAGYLMKHGIVKGDYIGICGANSMERILAEVAVIAAGGVVVQLTASKYDGSDIIDTMKATNCKGLFFDQKFSLANHSMHSTVLQNIEESHLDLSFTVMLRKELEEAKNLDIATILRDEYESIELPLLHPEDPITVYVTSGSTGNPKLIEMSHMPHINIAPCYPPEERPISYCDRPFAWLGGNIIRTICGNEIRVYPMVSTESTELKVEEAIEVMQIEKCVFGFFMPSFIQELLFRKSKYENTFRLKIIFASGYTMKSSLYEVVGTFCDILFIPYASTETHAISVNGPILPQQAIVVGDVGLPYPGVEVKIVDNDGIITKRGVPGEICVRSNYMSNGFHRSMKDTPSFLTSNRWAKTGDLGIINADGRIVIQGRMKDVITKDGRKYIPSFIEEPISKLHGIKNVMAIPVPDESINEEICVCFVSEDGVTEESIEKYCADVFSKEDIMLGLTAKPKYYFRFENFPVIFNGKPDKRKLIAIAVDRIKEKRK